MASTCRFAFAVHSLAVLAYKQGSDVSSEMLAQSVNTHAVVIRRLLCDLRAAGLVVTQRGPAGGARLSRAPSQISLCEVYRAVEKSRPFAAHPHEPNHRCPVGNEIAEALERVFATAQSALEESLAGQTLADILSGIGRSERRPARPASAALP